MDLALEKRTKFVGNPPGGIQKTNRTNAKPGNVKRRVCFLRISITEECNEKEEAYEMG